MAARVTRTLGFIALAMGLGACAAENPQLMNIRAQSSAPDEFSILPTRPLEQPESYAELPPPTPGGTNRTDRDPRAEAIASLGGNADRGAAASSGLIATTTRYGVAQDIRSVLAAEDLEFRRDNNGRILERAFNVNVYFKAYREQSLDQYGELRRLRRAGVRTVAAPPEVRDQN